MSFLKQDLREAMGCFATGITVVTTRGPKGELVGITANSFSSVSLDPALVLFSLDRRIYSLSTILSTDRFAIHVLGREQKHISNQFASSMTDKWSGIDYEISEHGCPVLLEALAVFECKTEHTYDGGDHIIFVGRILKMKASSQGEPLIYFRGKYL